MENAGLSIENNINIDSSLRNSVKYLLAHKLMDEHFTKWIAQQSTINLIQKLIEDCKKPNISLVFFPKNLEHSKSYICY